MTQPAMDATRMKRMTMKKAPMPEKWCAIVDYVVVLAISSRVLRAGDDDYLSLALILI
jgi:hypothetical protein